LCSEVDAYFCKRESEIVKFPKLTTSMPKKKKKYEIDYIEIVLKDPLGEGVGDLQPI
jgi:hypothetical protein